jgi:hypothetical protein
MTLLSLTKQPMNEMCTVWKLQLNTRWDLTVIKLSSTRFVLLIEKTINQNVISNE